MVDSPFRMRVLRVLSVLLAYSGLVFAQHGGSRSPDVVLITLDTTRADRMGFLGSQRGLTPNLDDLARRGTSFLRAYSQAPLTPVSHSAILTGTYPQFNRVNDFGQALPSDVPYLPELLRQHGYKTAAFVGSLILDPISGTAPGFDRGFDVYGAGFHMKAAKDNRYDTIERRAADVVGRALAWLSKRPANAPPFFLWVHLYDPHDPYDPPEPYKSKFSDPYDGEIAYADAMLGKLFAALRMASLYDGSLIALMADHGEALGEHGESTHGIFLYDETIHVPLLIKLPGGRTAPQKGEQKVDTRVGLVDVMPTILEAAGFAIPKEVQGKSLLGLMKPVGKPGSREPDRPVYSETDYPHRAFHWSSVRAMRSGKYLVVETTRPELYDQSTDPGALKNLAGSSPAVAGTLIANLEGFRQKTTSDLATAAKLDPEQAEKLHALGYVGGDSGLGHEGKIGGTDPKDRIEIANLMHDGMAAVEQGRNEAAIPKLEKVIQSEPTSAIAHVQLGTAWTRLRNYQKALPILQKAVELKADSSMAQYELGLALFETGSWAEAAGQFEKVVARMPKWADAQFSLGSVYARVDRVPEAMQHLDICLEIDPGHYRANLLRGRILSLQGKPAEALPNLKKATEVQSDSREAHKFLADAYEQLGDSAKAAEERRLAGNQ